MIAPAPVPSASPLALVTLHLGFAGMVVAGTRVRDHEWVRERRDRIRAAWLAAGWDWPIQDGPDGPENPRFDVQGVAPHLDIPTAAVLLVAYCGLPRPVDNARLSGVIRPDGRVADGVAWYESDRPWDPDGDARVVRHLTDLPDVLAWLSGTAAPIGATR